MEEYLKLIPSNASLVAAYSSFSTTWVLFKTAYNQIIPTQLQEFVVSQVKYYFSQKPSYSNFTIDQFWNGQGRNELYDAAQAYLSTKIGPKNHKLKVGKLEQKKTVSVAITGGGQVEDTFQGIQITWLCVHKERDKNGGGQQSRQGGTSKCCYQISFDSKYIETVQNEYLIHVLKTYKALMDKDKVLKLYTRINSYDRSWNAVEFHHPATFETLALDPEIKKSIIEDLDRFMARKEFYKGVGKAWKRGYLLYGPPGTGKSSLIAAMANYLNFDVYDLDLGSICSDAELRKLLLNTTNRSILIIEDIDCNSEVRDRSKISKEDQSKSDNKYCKSFTLSTLLNCIDGLWSSCGEARVVVFTTNHKEVLDPALLRPGRMDMHINMSYCTSQCFRVLAFNYLGISDHKLFAEINGLLESENVTPAALAEELMKSDDPDVALGEVLNFLNRKKIEEVKTDHQEIEN